MSLESRVWIYQADRKFNENEMELIERRAADFVGKWTSHNQRVMADFEVRYNRFLILFLDESEVAAGGCSIDSSVHFIKSIESELQNPMTDRMKFAYKSGENVEVVTKNEFERLIADGIISEDTIVFNNLVHTKEKLDSDWEIAMHKSWHRQFFTSKI